MELNELVKRSLPTPRDGYDIRPFSFKQSVHPMAVYLVKLFKMLTVNGEIFCIAGG